MPYLLNSSRPWQLWCEAGCSGEEKEEEKEA